MIAGVKFGIAVNAADKTFGFQTVQILTDRDLGSPEHPGERRHVHFLLIR